jgi:hypothetical protein
MNERRFGTTGLLQIYERVMLTLLALDDGDHLWRFVRGLLNGLGFYWLHHRMAVTIWRRGKFLYVLEAPAGHRWQHYWHILNEEEAGPEISLTPRLAAVSYGNLPTTLGSDRPISVSMRLMVSYLFEPQAFPNASPDFVEAQIRNSPEARDESVRRFCRPELERLLGELNPIEVRLRYTDQVLRQVLQERLGSRLSSIAFRILMVDIEEVILPPELETEIVANLELLRQSIRNYTPADIARVVTARMSEGMRQGHSPLAEVSIDPIIRRSMSEGTASVIDADAGGSLKSPPPPPPPPPPEPKPPEPESEFKETPPKIKRKPH